MSFKSCATLGLAVLSLGLLFGCSGASTSGGANQNAVITRIANGVHAAGTAMHTTTANKMMTTSVCDVHGYPLVSQMDGNYPGYLAHCFMSEDTGDTVLGGFDMAKRMTCIMDNAHLTYDGVTRTVSIDTTVAALCNLPTDSALSASVTASSPASFNSNFSHGVIIDLSSTVGGVFKIATNVAGTTSSFVTSESWNDGSIGTTSGKMDTSTGDLWYESRIERNNCTTESRCGWNRHTRIKASVVLTNGEPTGLNAMSFGYSNIQFTPGQSGFGGIVVDADGDMTTGIKARMWQATHDGVANHNATGATDYDTISNWVEVTNSACYTSTSETATTCGSGLPLFSTNTKFLLNATDSHVSVADWLATITGQTFTAVNMDDDTQF